VSNTSRGKDAKNGLINAFVQNSIVLIRKGEEEERQWRERREKVCETKSRSRSQAYLGSVYIDQEDIGFFYST